MRYIPRATEHLYMRALPGTEAGLGGPLPPHGWQQLEICERSSDECVGDCAYQLLPESAPVSAQIRIALHAAADLRGYGLEALSELVDHLRRQFSVSRICAETVPHCPHVATMLERLQFQPVYTSSQEDRDIVSSYLLDITIEPSIRPSWRERLWRFRTPRLWRNKA